jgi:hypothetical protein
MRGQAAESTDGGRKTGPLAVPAALYMAAAVVGFASYALGWGRITFPAHHGSETHAVGHRPMILILSALLLLVGFALRANSPRRRGPLRSALVPALIGVIAMGWATFDLVNERTRAVALLEANTAKALHLSLQRVQSVIEPQVQAGIVQVRFAPGIWLAYVSGVLALIGAGLTWRALARMPRRETAPVVATQPVPGDGLRIDLPAPPPAPPSSP